jgi:hypothetical protein
MNWNQSQYHGSMSLSGDGSVLAVQALDTMVDSEEALLLPIVDVLVWNGTSYQLESRFELYSDSNSTTSVFSPVSLRLSRDGNVIAFGHIICENFQQLRVYYRTGESTWVTRNDPPAWSACLPDTFEDQPALLSLSADGSTLALTSNGTANVYYCWARTLKTLDSEFTRKLWLL